MTRRALDWLSGTDRAGRSFLILLAMLIPILATAFDVRSGGAVSPAVWFWGDYPVGVSGPCDDPGVTTSRPTPIPGLSNVASLAAGLDRVIALKTDGTVWTWGSDASHVAKLSQVPTLSDVTAIAASSGSTFALALKADGTVWAWGDNRLGELGIGENAGDLRTTPVRVPGLNNVRAIGAGDAAGAAATADGSVWLWGEDYGLHPGGASLATHWTPVRLHSVPDVVRFAGGSTWMLALTVNGSVWAQGDNGQGLLGLGTQDFHEHPDFEQIPSLQGVKAIAAGRSSSLVLKTDGTVWTWGEQLLGNGAAANAPAVTTPIQVPGLSNVTAIAAGSNHKLVLKADGTVWAWGDNSVGELGNGYCSASPAESPNTPQQVSGLSGITTVAAGGFTSVAGVTHPLARPTS